MLRHNSVIWTLVLQPPLMRDAVRSCLGRKYIKYLTVNSCYNGHNLIVYGSDVLEALRHLEGFVIRKLFKIRKNASCNYSILWCTSMIIPSLG
jgi:hypothetical protein